MNYLLSSLLFCVGVAAVLGGVFILDKDRRQWGVAASFVVSGAFLVYAAWYWVAP